MEDTVRYQEEFNNIFFVESFVFVIIVQAEFCMVNCPLSPPSPVNCSCKIPSDQSKNHLRNIKYFLLKR